MYEVELQALEKKGAYSLSDLLYVLQKAQESGIREVYFGFEGINQTGVKTVIHSDRTISFSNE